MVLGMAVALFAVSWTAIVFGLTYASYSQHDYETQVGGQLGRLAGLAVPPAACRSARPPACASSCSQVQQCVLALCGCACVVWVCMCCVDVGVLPSVLA